MNGSRFRIAVSYFPDAASPSARRTAGSSRPSARPVSDRETDVHNIRTLRTGRAKRTALRSADSIRRRTRGHASETVWRPCYPPKLQKKCSRASLSQVMCVYQLTNKEQAWREKL